MMRSCHGLFSYLRPVGHEPETSSPGFSALMRAMRPCTSGKPSVVPGSGSATRTALLGNARATSFDAGLLPQAEVATTRATKLPAGALALRVVVGVENDVNVWPGALPT